MEIYISRLNPPKLDSNIIEKKIRFGKYKNDWIQFLLITRFCIRSPRNGDIRVLDIIVSARSGWFPVRILLVKCLRSGAGKFPFITAEWINMVEFLWNFLYGSDSISEEGLYLWYWVLLVVEESRGQDDGDDYCDCQHSYHSRDGGVACSIVGVCQIGLVRSAGVFHQKVVEEITWWNVVQW